MHPIIAAIIGGSAGGGYKASTTLTAYGPPGKDGFSGYDAGTARGSLADPYFFMGVLCTELSANNVVNQVVLELTGTLPQNYIRQLDCSLGSFQASAATFSTSGGFSTWSWSAGSAILSSGEVTLWR